MISFRRRPRGPAAQPAPADALIAAGEQLAEILAAENAALGALDLSRATGLVLDKAGALATFEAARRAMSGRRIEDSEQWCAADDLSRRLDLLARENRRLLERAMFVQKRVIALFARAAIRGDAPHYGARPQAVRPMAISSRA